MLSIVNPTQKDAATIHSSQHQQWELNNQQGHQHHQQGLFSKAIAYFSASSTIAKQLQEQSISNNVKKSGLEMLYISSHNLAACYNACNKSQAATDTLRELHRTLINMASNKYKKRALRLEALANLDKSLFSLASQLGYINQVDEIHNIIMSTEHIAANVSEELLNCA